MKDSRFFFIGGSALLLPLLIVLVPWYPWQLSAGLLLIAFWPGYALLVALWPHSGEASLTELERWLIAAPISYSLTIILLLVIVFARLPLNAFSVAGGLGILTLLFTFVAWQHKSANQPMANDEKQGGAFVYSLILLLLLAAFFRMTNIHYSDYQGDEADILLRAVALVYGHTETLLTHSKGPGEILLLNAVGALTGRFDEQTARLPFSLAGTISIGLIVLLGQQLFNRWVGLAAGLLAAIDGVFVSYARTAQYQSLVLLLTLTAIYGFYRFYQTDGQSRRWHGAGTFLLAVSFLFHFETILLLPVVAYLTVAGAERRGRAEARIRNDASGVVASSPHTSEPKAPCGRFMFHVLRLWPSVLIFTTIVAAFYVPFLLHPNVKSTGAYLENRIGGGSLPPFNNLAHFFYFEALKYNSAYYVALFNVLLALAMVLILAGVPGSRGAQENSRPRTRAKPPVGAAPLLLCLTVALLILGGMGLALVEQTHLSAMLLALGFALFFALVILSPQSALPQRVLWLWLAPPFWIYVFWVNRPGKHHYLFLGALTLWVGWLIVQIWQEGMARWPGLRQPLGRWLAVGLGGMLLVIFAGHTFMLFLRSDLEYVLTYPAHKSSFYPTDAAYPYGSRIGFGYPFRLGWQLIGQLRRTGQLQGSWAGNDDGNAPNWYMLGARSTPCYPHYVLQGEITYKGDDDFDVPFDPANFGYTPRYRLWGNGQLRMTILEFKPIGQTEVVDLEESARFDPPVTAADFAATMPQQSGEAPAIRLEPPPVLGEGSELKNNAPPEYLERAQQLAGRVALLGYDLDETYAQPGGIVPITLYWQTHSLLNLRYKVFAHLISVDERVWAQADDFPACGTSHANTWPIGAVALDRHMLKLPPDLAPGDYTLLMGMYEPDLNLRLNYFDIAGNEQGNSLKIGTLTIKPAE